MPKYRRAETAIASEKGLMEGFVYSHALHAFRQPKPPLKPKDGTVQAIVEVFKATQISLVLISGLWWFHLMKIYPVFYFFVLVALVFLFFLVAPILTAIYRRIKCV